jgi:hypothetical protein
VNPAGESGTVYRLTAGTVVFFVRSDYRDEESARRAYRRRIAVARVVYERGSVRDDRGRAIGQRAVIRASERVPPELAGAYSGSDHQTVIVRTTRNQVFRIAGPSVRAVTAFEKSFVTWNAPN